MHTHIFDHTGLKKKKKSEVEIDLNELKKCHRIAAEIVSLYGSKYLPIFIRIEDEIKKLSDKEKMIMRAKKIANSKE